MELIVSADTDVPTVSSSQLLISLVLVPRAYRPIIRSAIPSANRHCKLERAGEARLHHSPYSKEERLKLALQYLEEHGAMRVAEYMELTGLSRTKATLELKEFRQDLSSGITFIGRGSAKVYVKALEEKSEE